MRYLRKVRRSIANKLLRDSRVFSVQPDMCLVAERVAELLACSVVAVGWRADSTLKYSRGTPGNSIVNHPDV